MIWQLTESLGSITCQSLLKVQQVVVKICHVTEKILLPFPLNLLIFRSLKQSEADVFKKTL